MEKPQNVVNKKEDKKMFIMNPPILKGIETKFKGKFVEVKNIDGPFKKNKILTKVIKTDNDNNYFKQNIEAKQGKKNIRSPPNFF
jgi:hypothetical protein